MIRTAAPTDARTVVDLAVASGLFGLDDAPVVEAMMDGYFERTQTDGHRCVLDEDDAGHPRGVAYYEPALAADGTWYLTMIAVAADQQGSGVGRGLMAHVERDLGAQGQRLLLVETSGVEGFARTRAFYDTCGYDREARVRDYYAAGDDMVLFRKDLQP